MKTIAIAAALAATILGTQPASAWVAYHDAGAWRGPMGGIHTYNNYGIAGTPHYAYGYGVHVGGWGPPPPPYFGAGAVAAGVAAGAVIGATIASLPHGCVPYGALYGCGGVYYQPYYGPMGVVYQVVPAP